MYFGDYIHSPVTPSTFSLQSWFSSIRAVGFQLCGVVWMKSRSSKQRVQLSLISSKVAEFPSWHRNISTGMQTCGLFPTMYFCPKQFPTGMRLQVSVKQASEVQGLEKGLPPLRSLWFFHFTALNGRSATSSKGKAGKICLQRHFTKLERKK